MPELSTICDFHLRFCFLSAIEGQTNFPIQFINFSIFENRK